MRKKEIERKFDEAADLSGVAKFLDTPVKRYSTGMYVRLVFSVAAHLEPDLEECNRLNQQVSNTENRYFPLCFISKYWQTNLLGRRR